MAFYGIIIKKFDCLKKLKKKNIVLQKKMAAFFYLLNSKNFGFFINILSTIILCYSTLGFCISFEIEWWKKWQTLNFGLLCVILLGIFVIYFLFTVQQQHEIEVKEFKEEKRRIVRI